MIKKLLSVLLAVLTISLILSLVSCTPKKSTSYGNFLESEFVKSEYNLGEDVVFNISVGFPAYWEAYSIFPAVYKVAVTNNADVWKSEDFFVLKEITEFDPEIYGYTVDEQGKRVYRHHEQIVIPAEIFSGDSGTFFLGLLEVNFEGNVCTSTRSAYSYKLVGEKIIVSRVAYGSK